MATNKSVNVLAPNGRRQNVKVSSNTTLLQILEEVCRKQGFKPEEYDIRHHNHVLDTNTVLQFSGLPNNAQLELTPALKLRQESNITLGIQLENGQRLMKEFPPSATLWHVLEHTCPEEAKIETNPIIVYMRQEIYGRERFESTTLRSLGLTGGRAMLRLFHKDPSELKQQANVSAPLPSRPSVEDKPIERKPTTQTKPQNDIKMSKPEPVIASSSQLKQEVSKPKEIKTVNKPEEKSRRTPSPTPRVSQSKPVPVRMTTSEVEIVFLGERNALAFSLEMSQSLPHEDLPDSFFDLTVNDARKIWEDLKRRRAEMEEAPLLTAAQRDLEKSTKILRDINQYKRSVLRIQFPDRTVLQGTFGPLETVATVIAFVREYLEDKTIDFHLYLTPPKRILSMETRLVDAECVPSAILHFGTNLQVDPNVKFLRNDLLTRLSSYNVASLAASRSRNLKTTQQIPMELESSTIASTSGPSTGAIRKTTTTPESSGSEKIPKWFKKP